MALIYARRAGVKLFDWLRRSRAILPGFPPGGRRSARVGRSDVVRLTLRLIVEEALDDEVSGSPGRERSERGEGASATRPASS